jgi:hypothetical protein
MAWPTTVILPDQEADNFEIAPTRSFGPDATPSYQAAYDEGYADGVAAGGGSSPTEGQIWPRGVGSGG